MEDENEGPDWSENVLDRLERLDKEKKDETRKNTPSYIWNVVVAVIEIFIAVSVTESVYGESLVIAGSIMLVYVSLRTMAITYARMNLAQSLGLAKEIFLIKEKLGIELEDDAADKLLEGNQLYRKMEINIVIRSLGLTIIFFIALLAVLSNT